MDLTEETYNPAVEAGEQTSDQMSSPVIGDELLKENGHNLMDLQIMLEEFLYGFTEVSVSGMHLSLGKPHQPDQLII